MEGKRMFKIEEMILAVSKNIVDMYVYDNGAVSDNGTDEINIIPDYSYGIRDYISKGYMNAENITYDLTKFFPYLHKVESDRFEELDKWVKRDDDNHCGKRDDAVNSIKRHHIVLSKLYYDKLEKINEKYSKQTENTKDKVTAFAQLCKLDETDEFNKLGIILHGKVDKLSDVVEYVGMKLISNQSILSITSQLCDRINVEYKDKKNTAFAEAFKSYILNIANKLLLDDKIIDFESSVKMFLDSLYHSEDHIHIFSNMFLSFNGYFNKDNVFTDHVSSIIKDLTDDTYNNKWYTVLPRGTKYIPKFDINVKGWKDSSEYSPEDLYGELSSRVVVEQLGEDDTIYDEESLFAEGISNILSAREAAKTAKFEYKQQKREERRIRRDERRSIRKGNRALKRVMDISTSIELLKSKSINLITESEKQAVIKDLNDLKLELIRLKPDYEYKAKHKNEVYQQAVDLIVDRLAYVDGVIEDLQKRDIRLERRTIHLKIDPTFTDQVKG